MNFQHFNSHRGWTITFDANRPVTGLWRAERFGVGMGAGSREQLIRMIDNKVDDEARERREREKGKS